ncbi:integrase [Pseudoalteromonas sp. XI10]|nr:integrase [Pseudoalteromonas sp. XI10]
MKKLCSWLSVSPAGYYKWLKQLPSTRQKENSSLLKFLKHISDQEHCIPGYRKLWEAAVAHGFDCSKGRVQRLLQSVGYRSKSGKRRYTSRAKKEGTIKASNLLRRQFNVDVANTVWVSDITQVRCKDGWQYLCVILDLYSRKVVGWVTSRINNAELVIKTLRKAWSARKPDGVNLLFHSDQGAQYVAKETVKWLTNRGVTVSMSRKGNCWDNACSESFFAQYKKEWIKNLNELSRSEMTTQTYFYIEKYYNSVRRHGTLGYKSPMQYEQVN